MKVLIKLLGVIIILISGNSCGRDGQRGNGDDNYFSAFHHFRQSSWAYDDTLFFRVDTLRDSFATGPLTLSLRHYPGYIWSNIWIEVSLRDDSVLVADTFNIPLADVYGNWFGSGTGILHQLTYPLYDEVTLARGDTVFVRHIMRVDELQSIDQLGIIFAGKP